MHADPSTYSCIGAGLTSIRDGNAGSKLISKNSFLIEVFDMFYDGTKGISMSRDENGLPFFQRGFYNALKIGEGALEGHLQAFSFWRCCAVAASPLMNYISAERVRCFLFVQSLEGAVHTLVEGFVHIDGKDSRLSDF
jgi:hypothetical protein